MKTKEFREFEKRANALRFDLTERAREAHKRAEGRLQEVGKDAQYWVEVGESSGLYTAINILEEALTSRLDID